MINLDTQAPLNCVNCQTVTTNDGRTVWVCERCGVQNDPGPVVPDEATAQAEILAAAAQTEVPAAAPVIPETPAAVTPPVTAAVAPQTPPVTAIPAATDQAAS